MLIKNFINLSRINVFAASNDHIGFAIHDVKEAILVAIADITGMKPAAPKGPLGSLLILEVALQNIFAAQNDLAQFAIWNLVIFVVDYFHLIADWQTARARPARFIRRIK